MSAMIDDSLTEGHMKKQLSRRQLATKKCTHAHTAIPQEVDELVCPECVALGDSWVHLRVCMICGHVGCCDSSKNKHATAHFRSSGHPIVMSIEPGEIWAWCYEDNTLL